MDLSKRDKKIARKLIDLGLQREFANSLVRAGEILKPNGEMAAFDLEFTVHFHRLWLSTLRRITQRNIASQIRNAF